ncbi:MAG: acyl-CoA/acyl-ACP dehydrogenase [Proteobacteria bacterium]|nr:acyl-CoA/acyl-ACP dehydrogenase [Pseudomonadota bacterium]
MDFTLNNEQKAICRSIRDLCNDAFNDDVMDDDNHGSFSKYKWLLCGDVGIQGLVIPDEYDGSGYDMLTTALSIESLGQYCKDEGLIFSLCANICTCIIPLCQFGTQNQKDTYLPGLASGRLIGGNGITEENAGSDSSAIQTDVTKNGDGFVINGTKLFVTNAPVADLLLIYAKHPGGMKMADTSCFVIDTQNPGIMNGQTFQKMGLRTSPLSEVVLKNCTVGTEDLLGRERFGMMVFNHSMMWERIIMGAYHVGAMEQQYQMVLSHANTRSQFGRSIKKFSGVSDKLVDMKMRIDSARLMLYHTCWKYDQSKADLSDASMIKLMTSEAKVKNSLSALQVFGAYGYMTDSHVQKQVRDSLAATLYSGTSEMQKKIIGEHL